jgi:hypothetical protein
MSTSLTDTKEIHMETVYIIRRVNTNEMVEGHDELSRAWGQRKVDVHNSLYPADQWVMVEEQL